MRKFDDQMTSVGMTRGEIKKKITERLNWFRSRNIYFEAIPRDMDWMRRLCKGYNVCWEPGGYFDGLDKSFWKLWLYEGDQGVAGHWVYSDYGMKTSAMVSRMVDWIYDQEEKKLHKYLEN